MGRTPWGFPGKYTSNAKSTEPADKVPKGADPAARVPTHQGFVQSSEEHGDNSPAGRHPAITQAVQNSSHEQNGYRLSDDDSELSSPPASDDDDFPPTHPAQPDSYICAIVEQQQCRGLARITEASTVSAIQNARVAVQDPTAQQSRGWYTQDDADDSVDVPASRGPPNAQHPDHPDNPRNARRRSDGKRRRLRPRRSNSSSIHSASSGVNPGYLMLRQPLPHPFQQRLNGFQLTPATTQPYAPTPSQPGQHVFKLKRRQSNTSPPVSPRLIPSNPNVSNTAGRLRQVTKRKFDAVLPDDDELLWQVGWSKTNPHKSNARPHGAPARQVRDVMRDAGLTDHTVISHRIRTAYDRVWGRGAAKLKREAERKAKGRKSTRPKPEDTKAMTSTITNPLVPPNPNSIVPPNTMQAGPSGTTMTNTRISPPPARRSLRRTARAAALGGFTLPAQPLPPTVVRQSGGRRIRRRAPTPSPPPPEDSPPPTISAAVQRLIYEPLVSQFTDAEHPYMHASGLQTSHLPYSPPAYPVNPAPRYPNFPWYGVQAHLLSAQNAALDSPAPTGEEQIDPGLLDAEGETDPEIDSEGNPRQ